MANEPISGPAFGRPLIGGESCHLGNIVAASEPAGHGHLQPTSDRGTGIDSVMRS